MDSELVFGWNATWAVFLLATVIYWLEISFDILSGVKIFLSDACRCRVHARERIGFSLIPDWDKLHLYWLALLILTVTDCIEYRRVPSFIRIMRRVAGKQPIKHSPSLTISWLYGRATSQDRL